MASNLSQRKIIDAHGLCKIGRYEMIDPVQLENASGRSSAVIVCEHASHFFPPEFGNLGLDQSAAISHAAWDPGALGVTRRLAHMLDGVAVTGTISRLVYDLNRPPSAPDAMTPRSELIDVPGNVDLPQSERTRRTVEVYRPFQDTLSGQLKQTPHPVMITVHSFTPVYNGKQRAVEIGVLHDSDTRLADAMMTTANNHTRLQVERNEPYGPEHGVTHTLREHAVANGYPNVMLEVRNDLLKTEEQQIEVADMLARWISDAFSALGQEGDVQCKT